MTTQGFTSTFTVSVLVAVTILLASVAVKMISQVCVELTHGAREVSVGSTKIFRLPRDPTTGLIAIADSEHESVKVTTPH